MGELARKPGCPELADTPLGLLTPRPGEGFTALDKWTAPVASGIIFVSMSALYNLAVKRPWWAGMHVHILAGAVGYYVGLKIQEVKFASRSERDAVLKHYMTLHPEDFPPYENQRFRDVYYPFKPIR